MQWTMQSKLGHGRSLPSAVILAPPTLIGDYRNDEQGLGQKWTFDAHQLGVVSVATDPTGQSK